MLTKNRGMAIFVGVVVVAVVASWLGM